MIDLIYFIYLLVLEMGEGGKGESEREREICCSIRFCIHWVLLVSALRIEPTTLVYLDDALTN